MSYVMVFIGGGLGAASRLLVSRIMQSYKFAFPLGAFTANVISCIILGVLLGYFAGKPESKNLNLLLLTGFCGGFSTFSTFTAELFKLLQNGEHTAAFSYVMASVLICLFALWLGFRLYSALFGQ